MIVAVVSFVRGLMVVVMVIVFIIVIIRIVRLPKRHTTYLESITIALTHNDASTTTTENSNTKTKCLYNVPFFILWQLYYIFCYGISYYQHHQSLKYHPNPNTTTIPEPCKVTTQRSNYHGTTTSRNFIYPTIEPSSTTN